MRLALLHRTVLNTLFYLLTGRDGIGWDISQTVTPPRAPGGANKVAEPNIQLTKITMTELDIVTIYRSHDEPLFRAVHFLQNLIDPKKDTLVIGDVNYDASKENELCKYLNREGFTQLVTLPTHILGGKYIFSQHNSCVKSLQLP